MHNYRNTFDGLSNKRLVYYVPGLGQGRSYFSNRAKASSSSSSSTSKTSSAPTTKQLSFGSTLQSAIEASKGKPSPFNLSNYRSGGGSSSGSRSGLNFSVPTSSPAPTTSFGDLSKPNDSGLQFGSNLLKAIQESQSKASPFNISAAQNNPNVVSQVNAISEAAGTNNRLNFNPSAGDFGTVGLKTNTPLTSTNSPWNISRAQAALGQAGIDSLKTGNIRNLNFDLFNKTVNKAQEEQKQEEEQPVVPPVPEEAPQPEQPNTINDLNSIQQQILELMKPSAEEQALMSQINSEIGALELGMANVEDQPIPLGFITGQSASLEKRGSLRMAPLQRKLQLLQDSRLSKLKAYETALGFQEGELSRQFQSEQSNFSNRVALATKGLRYDPSTDQFYRDDSLAEPVDPAEKANLESGLRKEFNGLSRVKNYEEMSAQVSKMEAAYKHFADTGQGANFVDQALITIFNKINDPGSVVRESEFARSAENLSLLQSLDAKVQALKKGGVLNAGAREELLQVARSMYNEEQKSFNQLADWYGNVATNNGLDINSIIYRPTQEFSDLDPTASINPIPTNSGITGNLILDLDADILSGASSSQLIQAYSELTVEQIAARKQELANAQQEILQNYLRLLGL